MNDITAETVALTFATGWIARFGVPSTINSDRGRQFESRLWTSLMQLLGCKHLRTTSYHPVIVERFHPQLKASLKAPTPTAHWIESLPLVLLGIRTALETDLQCSTAELVYCTILRLPGEFFQQSTTDTPPDPTTLITRLRDTMRDIKATPVRPQPQRNIHVSKDLSSCTHVFVSHDAVRKPLQQPCDGPYRVLDKIDINGRQDTVSLDRLKPTHLAPTNQPNGPVISHPSPSAPPLSHPPSPPPSLSSPPTTRPIRTTRSGRHVHFPQRLMVTFIPC